MWTTQLIELMASGYSPQGWSNCPTCKVEYNRPILAYNCWKGHQLQYERVYSDLELGVKKHEVAFDGDSKPLCRGCVKRAAKEAAEEVALTVVQMAEPPSCNRCGRPIQDPPFQELTPNRLPLSERHRDLILQPSRAGRGALQDYSVYKGLKDWHPETGSPVVDPRLFKQFGVTVPDGRGGHPRTASGYIEVKEAEGVSCNIPTY